MKKLSEQISELEAAIFEKERDIQMNDEVRIVRLSPPLQDVYGTVVGQTTLLPPTFIVLLKDPVQVRGETHKAVAIPNACLERKIER